MHLHKDRDHDCGSDMCYSDWFSGNDHGCDCGCGYTPDSCGCMLTPSNMDTVVVVTMDMIVTMNMIVTCRCGLYPKILGLSA